MEKDRDILFVAIFTFLTISVWIFFEMIKTTKTSTINNISQELVKPLNTKLDLGTLDQLNNRQVYK